MGLEMASSSAGSSEGERGAFLGGCDCATMRHVCSVLFGDVDPSPWLPDEKSALGSGFDRLAGQDVHPQNLPPRLAYVDIDIDSTVTNACVT